MTMLTHPFYQFHRADYTAQQDVLVLPESHIYNYTIALDALATQPTTVQLKLLNLQYDLLYILYTTLQYY